MDYTPMLDILVENMGRINYGSEIVHNTKGIISPVLMSEFPITVGWHMYRLPFDSLPPVPPNAPPQTDGRAALYKGKFVLEKTGDTFLDMRGWGKGIVIVNGHNLGRYWHVGPQQTLYLPGCWLKKGVNEIAVFEQLNDHIKPIIPTIDQPILNELKQ